MTTPSHGVPPLLIRIDLAVATLSIFLPALVIPLRLLGVHSKGRAVAQKILEVGGPASAGEVHVISKASEDELPMGQSCDDTQIPTVKITLII